MNDKLDLEDLRKQKKDLEEKIEKAEQSLASENEKLINSVDTCAPGSTFVISNILYLYTEKGIWDSYRVYGGVITKGDPKTRVTLKNSISSAFYLGCTVDHTLFDVTKKTVSEEESFKEAVDLVLEYNRTPRNDLFEYPHRADDSMKIIAAAEELVRKIRK